MRTHKKIPSALLAATLLATSIQAVGDGSDQWRLHVADEFAPFLDTEMPYAGTPEEVATTIVQQLRKQGILTAYAHIDPAGHALSIRSASVKAEGPLAEYLPTKLDQASLQGAMPLIRYAAAAQGGRPNVHVGQIKNGVLPVQADVQPTAASKGATVSSYGSRYSGENVASLFWAGGGSGWYGGLSGTVGLPWLTPKHAKGGRYASISAHANRPTTKGVIQFSGSVSDYKQGGDVKDYDLNGRAGKLRVTYGYPFEHGHPQIGMEYGYQNSEIGSAGLDGTQQFAALLVKMDGSVKNPSTGLSYTAQFTQGLWNTNKGSAIGRKVDRNWSVFTLDGRMTHAVGNWLLSASAGVQTKSKMQPNQHDFYLGGPGRGSGYHTGVASTASGTHFGMRLHTPPIRFGESGNTVRPFIGYNEGRGKPHAGKTTLRAESAEAGVLFQIGKHTSGELGYARITDSQGPHASKGRAIFNITSRF